ncbi:MAG: 16S rRNA (adenine(1518)-N(6)/adenine(1519)-N(6))-dimethyltransferase RsmA [Clostridia bacterium]|nr:16S rRNA (adenine(1518)-N(6)/adenine(1519)-N(6))-dimethyltransferase RsmA [Clostridia bacterium]
MDKLYDITVIKGILGRYGFTFSKGLGQNFLIDPEVCPKIAEYGVPDENYGVIEVGPGIGVLTNELGKAAKKVVAVEIDKRLIPVLGETMSDRKNVKVINDDVMKMDLHKLIEDEFDGMNVAVCANLPYYITSPVIMKLLEEKLPVDCVTVMVQKEAAERICAPAGTRDSGALTIAVRYYAEPEMLFEVKADSFMPAPKVDSAVIRLNIRKEPIVSPICEKTFFAVVKASFLQRRKVISNTLASGLGISKSEIMNLLESVDIPLNARAEQLEMEDFCRLADAVYKFKNK